MKAFSKISRRGFRTYGAHEFAPAHTAGNPGRNQRRQMRKLLRCDDRTLADMGFTRSGIRRALSMPRHAGTHTGTNNIHQQIMHPEQAGLRL